MSFQNIIERDPFLVWDMPSFPRSRRTGYAPQKNWLRTHIDEGGTSVYVMGERDYTRYYEPSERWTREISRALNQTHLVSHVLALGVARATKSGQEVRVVLGELYNLDEWEEFKKLYKPLMIVTRYYRMVRSTRR